MSTLKATNLQHASSASPNIVLDSSGNATMAGTMAMATPFAMKNKIINGAMEIDQRNAGASVTLTSGGVFGPDRWQGFEDTDGTMTMQQSSTAPVGFSNSLLFTTTSADSSLGASQYVIITQNIEGLNASDFAWGTANAKTVTLSFQVRSSLTGTFGGAIRNSAADRSYPFSFTISNANTWEMKTVTIPGDTTGTWLTTNGIGLRLSFGLGVGSSLSGTAGSWAGANYVSATGATSVVGTNGATFYLTGVQLEVGSVATPFERRLYPVELAMCQRYYQRFGDSPQIVYSGYQTTGNDWYITTPLQTEMRATPTAARVGTWTVGNSSQPGISASSKAMRLTLTITSTGAGFTQSGTGMYFTFDAEL